MLGGGYPIGYSADAGSTGLLRIPSTGPGGGNTIGCIGLGNGELGKGTRYFNGSIVDVQVYNATLTVSQLTQLFLQGIPQVSVLNITVG